MRRHGVRRGVQIPAQKRDERTQDYPIGERGGLLCSEPLGPVLSDLFSGGLMLSMPATLDLEEMLGHKRKARARAVDAPPDQPAAKEASPARASVKKAATKMLAKRGKDRSNPSSYLRMPKAVNGSAGKRCC